MDSGREADHSGAGECVRGLILALLLVAATCHASIGTDNRNPGNIRGHRCQDWGGAIAHDPWGHLIFRTDLDGLKAMRKVLAAYGRKHHINTVRGICARWVAKPKTKAQARELVGYVKAVAQRAGVGLDTPLDMADRKLLARVARGLVWAENGVDSYPESLFRQAFNY